MVHSVFTQVQRVAIQIIQLERYSIQLQPGRHGDSSCSIVHMVNNLIASTQTQLNLTAIFFFFNIQNKKAKLNNPV